MQLKTFKTFFFKVIYEGNRLQRVNIHGEITTNNWFTQTQVINILISVLIVYKFSSGFSDNFSGYVISFLSIFIGMFSSIIISLFEKGKVIIDELDKEKAKSKNNCDDNEKIEKLKLQKNYLIQFTGLTSYSILLALAIIGLLLFVLLNSKVEINLTKFSLVSSITEINYGSVKLFLKLVLIMIYRFTISYLLLNFFTITTYAVTSYFSYISSAFKNKIND